MFGCLKIGASHKEVKLIEPLKATKDVYKYELTKKQTLVKKRVRFADSEPTILGEEKEFEKRCISNELGEKEGIRVKIKLTKEEAAILLSKCNGRVLELKDVARELLSISGDRVSIMSTLANNF